MRTLLIAGNWKMNLLRSSAVELAQALANRFAQPPEGIELLVCPPFPYLIPVHEVIAGSAVQLGAQTSYFEPPGAFTGEVANEMLVDVGCRYVIQGHSERRHVLGESDTVVNRKVRASLQRGLRVILCVGERLEERQAGQTEQVLDRQLETGLREIDAAAAGNVVVAYEPVWAIGTGVVATEQQAQSAHAHIRNWLASRYNPEFARAARILYGGSVKPQNAEGLLAQPDVDGALVGGASLKADSFCGIVDAAVRARASAG
ncbi:MAG: triose-phosphate isomerase [Planctomycetota bacterium]|nr:MAG: triose-phosphate isomerase [Planctomycetota bacterium]